METISIVDDNYIGKWTEHRIACRGIVIRDDKILLSYESNTNLWNIPGGGLENNETKAACCCREIAEETGFVVSAKEPYLTLNLFYFHSFYETHYFACNITGATRSELTEREKSVGIVPKWMSIADALSIFSKYQDYSETDEEKREIYFREYTALKTFLNMVKFLKTGD